MGGVVHRPWYRTGVNGKHEDEWWLSERKGDDRATASDMAPFDASLCLNESCHAGSHGSLLQYRRENNDISESRKNRDMKDTQALLNALAEHNLFTAQQGLRNIMNGVHANDTVNVDDAKDIGQGILASMTGKYVTEFAFKRR